MCHITKFLYMRKLSLTGMRPAVHTSTPTMCSNISMFKFSVPEVASLMRPATTALLPIYFPVTSFVRIIVRWEGSAATTVIEWSQECPKPSLK